MKRVLLINRNGKQEIVSLPTKDGVQPTVIYTLDDTGRMRMFRYDYMVAKDGGRSYQRFSEAESVPVLARSLPEGF